MNSPIAVTGAGGYIGGRLVRHLMEAGRPVVALSRGAVPWLSGVVQIDLAAADPQAIGEAIAGCSAVVHLAGANEVHAARDPDGALARTAAAARRTAVAAQAVGVNRFVYVSTVHVYGGALDRGERVDEDTVPEPLHPYALARLAAEHLIAAAGLESLVVLRLTNAVGAPADARVDRWTLVALDLCRQAAAGGPLELRSSGLQWRDFVDLGDVCRSIEAAATGLVPAGLYNLGSGASRTVRSLADVVAEVAAPMMGRRLTVNAPPHLGHLPLKVEIDVSRLALHVEPAAVPIERSVQEVLELCRSAGTP